MAFMKTQDGLPTIVDPKWNNRLIHPHNFSLVISILEVFEIEGIDASASGILRVASYEPTIFLETAINIMLPRDYTPPISGFQRERIVKALMEQGWR